MDMDGRMSVFAVNNLLALESNSSVNMTPNSSAQYSQRFMRYLTFPVNQQHQQNSPVQQMQQQQQQQQAMQPQSQQQLLQESQQQQTRAYFKPRVLFHALMKYNVALVSLVPWGIAIFTMMQLKETFIVAPLIISFACFFGWLMAKVVQFLHVHLDQHIGGQQGSLATDPPPYEIVVAKPPPYNQLFHVSSSSPGPSHIDCRSHPYRHDVPVPKLLCCACKEMGNESCSKCRSQNRSETDEDSSLPSYEQALIMMSRGEVATE